MCLSVVPALLLISLDRSMKVQTIKTSVESAIMLLRIDDIVSGISKKSRGGGGQPSGTQTEDHDNVSISAALHSLSVL